MTQLWVAQWLREREVSPPLRLGAMAAGTAAWVAATSAAIWGVFQILA